MSRTRRSKKKTPAATGAETPPEATSGSPARRSAAFATAHRFADATAETPDVTAPAAAAPAAAAAEPVATQTAEQAPEAAPPAAGPKPAAEPAEPARTAAMAEAPALAPAGPHPADPYLESAAHSGDAADDAYGTGGYSERHDYDEPEHERSGFAATALMFLLGALAVAALTLWLAPKVAPSLPEGIARHLTPGQVDLESRIAELEQRLGEGRAAFEEQRAAFETQRSAFEELRSARESESGTVTGEIDRLGAEVEELRAALGEPGAGVADLGDRVGRLEQELAGLRDELSAMAAALAEAEQGEGPTTPELAAALARLQSRIESMAGETAATRDDLGQRLAELAARLDQAEARTDEAEQARESAEQQVEKAGRTASISSALAGVEADLASGNPYAEPLATLGELAGTAPPPALAEHAEAGLPSDATLAETISDAARRALAVDRSAAVSDNLQGRIAGWFRSQVAARPTAPTEGDSTGAILSRAEAKLEQGDAAAALAELESLPAPAREALGQWYQDLSARVAAEQALADWRAALSADG